MKSLGYQAAFFVGPEEIFLRQIKPRNEFGVCFELPPGTPPARGKVVLARYGIPIYESFKDDMGPGYTIEFNLMAIEGHA